MGECRKPCAECPFSRQGLTGGANPTVYVGQAFGPFLLPCHMDPNYEKDRRSPNLLQCAGAAVFRSNIGVAEQMPKFFIRLPADTERVFGGPDELLAYYCDISIKEARLFLQEHPPIELLRTELQKSGAQVVNVPSKEGSNGR